MEATETEIQSLAALVERFRVCWEVWPEYMFIKQEKRQIGFTLEIVGTHEADIEHPTPGCEHCLRVFAALRQIGVHILPKEQRPTGYEIQIYDHAIRYTPKRRNRPEVSLAIKILHRHEFELPVDECESRCLDEMKQRLRDLGAYEGHWRARMEDHR